MTQALGFTLDRKALQSALTAAGRVTEKRNTIPILSAVRFDVRPDSVTLIATDLDIQTAEEMPADTASTGSLVIAQLETLAKAVKQLTGESVRFADMGNGRASLTDCTSGASVTLGTFNAEDWPTLQAGDMLASFTLPADQFGTDVRTLLPLSSTEETRYYLNGIFMHQTHDEFGGDVLRMAVTDGHRLGRVTRALPEGLPKLEKDAKARKLQTGTLPDVIIPRKACAYLDKLIGKKPERPDVRIDVNAAKVQIRYGRTLVLTKVIDGTFPDYTRVVPYSNSHALELDQGTAFAAAVTGVTAICSEKTRAVGIGFAANEPVIVSAWNADGGKAANIYPGATFTLGSDRPFECVGMNAAYLTGILGAFGTGPVKMLLADAAAPIRIEGRDRPELLIVLMPMRVDSAPVTTRADVDRLTMNVFQRFNEDAAELAVSLKLSPTKANKQAVGAQLTAAIDFLVSTGMERFRARWVVKGLFAYHTNDGGTLNRAAAIAKALGSAPAQVIETAPAHAPAAAAEPVEDLAQDPAAQDLRAANDVEPLCSAHDDDPVIEPEPMPATEPEPESVAAVAVDTVEVVKLLTTTDQAVYVKAATWAAGDGTMRRYHRNGLPFGDKVVLRENIVRLVLPRGGSDKPAKAAPAVAPAAPVAVEAPDQESALSERLERLERIVAGLSVPGEAEARIAELEAQLEVATTYSDRLQKRRRVARRMMAHALRYRASARSAQAGWERERVRVADALAERDRYLIRADALERLHVDSDTLDRMGKADAKPRIILASR